MSGDNTWRFRNHIEENGKELKRRAREHEHMPDCMVVGQALPEIKDDAERIRDAAGRKKPEPPRRERFNQGLHHEDDAPA